MDLGSLVLILQAALGIGLVIFVHEAGHFVAARLCGVRVEVFSIGFGRRLVGWRRGTTLYQVGMIPLGGYVKMAGEDQHATTSPAPDTLAAKSANQRMFIFSGGVLMNLAFAVVVFPLLFARGVPFMRPTLGESVPGGPAWRAGLEPGTRVLAVDGGEVWDFLHILTSVAIGDPGGVELEVQDPGARTSRTVRLVPEKRADTGLADIGISQHRDPEGRVRVDPGGPAERAGLRDGDAFRGVVDAVPGLSPVDQYLVATRLGAPVRLRVAGEEGEREVLITPVERLLEQRRLLGITPPRNLVDGLRGELWREAGLREGDRLVSVGGRAILRLGDLELALSEAADPLVLQVLREGRALELAPPASAAELFAGAADLALASDTETTTILVEPDRPGARAGLRDLDRIREIDGEPVASFADVTTLVSRAAEAERAVALEVERDAAQSGALPEVLEIAAVPELRTVPDYGFDFEPDRYVFRADGPGESLRVGVACSWKMLEDTWLTLKRMLLRDVGPEHLGGIITIGVVSYSWAEEGLVKLFYFLCMLSINLAFINILPIPVLDGGHLVFLLIEKIKGSPVSERVLSYSQVVGVVLILSLMVYVTFNDIQRFFDIF